MSWKGVKLDRGLRKGHSVPETGRWHSSRRTLRMGCKAKRLQLSLELTQVSTGAVWGSQKKLTQGHVLKQGGLWRARSWHTLLLTSQTTSLGMNSLGCLWGVVHGCSGESSQEVPLVLQWVVMVRRKPEQGICNRYKDKAIPADVTHEGKREKSRTTGVLSLNRKSLTLG